MEVGLLVLRIIVGAFVVGHGAQKLFGWFGGHGLGGTGAAFESMGLRPGRTMAAIAGIAEVAGGSLLAIGLLTPLAAALLIAVMTIAIATVHWRHGPWVAEGGWEYNGVLIAVAFAVTATGPGKYSLDHALELDLAGVDWALIALGAGLVSALVVAAVARAQAADRAGTRPAGT
ncbi:MAG TPA: DoxX family protein [Solirubrobacter sp.]|nr:DoxX family protein [Solirubrobacter sp.]